MEDNKIFLKKVQIKKSSRRMENKFVLNRPTGEPPQ